MLTSVIKGGEVISALKNDKNKNKFCIEVDASRSGCKVEIEYVSEFNFYKFQVTKTNGKQDDNKNEVIAEWWMEQL